MSEMKHKPHLPIKSHDLSRQQHEATGKYTIYRSQSSGNTLQSRKLAHPPTHSLTHSLEQLVTRLCGEDCNLLASLSVCRYSSLK